MTSPGISSSILNKDLLKITQWSNQRKMSFDHAGIAKQAQEIVFSRKKNHPRFYLNNSRIQRQSVEKHLGILLAEKLSFFEYVDEKFLKSNSSG